MTERGVEMKLRKVQPVPVSDDSWQKCCRWCHHFQNGKCMNTDHLDTGEDLSVYKVSEDGYLDQCLEETLGSVKLEEFRELEYLLRGYNLSEKRIREFNDLFGKCWDNFRQNTLKTELEENVAKCYQNNIEKSSFDSNMVIKDPDNYCCKDWC